MHSLGPQMVMLASVLWAGINFLVVRWVVSLLHKNKLTYATLVFLWIVAAVEVSQSRLLSLPVLLFIRCRIPNANWLRVTTILEVPNETILSLSPSDIGTMWKSEDKEREYPSSWFCVDFSGDSLGSETHKIFKERTVLSCGFNTVLHRDWKAIAQETLRMVVVAPWPNYMQYPCIMCLPPAKKTNIFLHYTHTER